MNVQLKMNPSIILFAIIIFIVVFSHENLYSETPQLFGKSIEELLSIEVYSAGKQEQKITEIPASVVIITRDEIERYGYRTYMEILENVPGFYMNENYYFLGHSNFGVRGFYSDGSFDNVIIMVNGVNQIDDSYNSYPDSKINVPIEAIDRIEIIRGPMSVMYGSGAFMGAINIITNKCENCINNGKIKASYGTNNIPEGFLRWAGSSEMMSYSINASLSKNDGPDIPLRNLTDNIQNLLKAGVDTNSTTKGYLDEFRQYFNANFTLLSNTNFDFTLVNTKKGIYDGMPSIGEGSYLMTNSMSASFKQDFKPAPFYSFYVKAGMFSHSNIWNMNQIIEDSYSSVQIQEQSIDLEFFNKFEIEEKVNIVLGYYQRCIYNLFKQFDYPIFNPKYTNTKGKVKDNKNISNKALFAQIEYKPLSNIIIIGGLRAEYLNSYTLIYQSAYDSPQQAIYTGKCLDDKVNYIPRVAVIYNINPYNTLKLMYGKAIKQPTIGQNFSQILSEKPVLREANM